MRRPQPHLEHGETRAEIARRRLAQLAASFEAEVPTPDAELDRPAPVRSLSGAHVRVLITVAVAAGVLLTWWLLSERPRTSTPDDVTFSGAAASPATTASSGSPTPTGELVVDVAGKVKRPGIVTLPAGSRVHEAITEAGGLRGSVDTTALNMARVLTDGEQVVVGIDPPPTASTGGGGTTSARVSLGSATLEQLDTLPGVGPVTAQAIIDHRSEHGPFTSVDELLDVKGIGEATLADLRDRVTP